MKRRHALSLISVLLVLPMHASAQDLAQIEHKLKERYKHQPLVVNVSIARDEITYDLNGQPIGNFIQTCGRPELQVKTLKLTPQELVFQARGAARQIIFARGPRSVPPAARAKDVVVRIRSDGQPWDLGRINAALDTISEPRALRPSPGNVPPLPEGAQQPTAGSDKRIVFVLPAGPVYMPVEGITPPRAIEASDPDYTDAARKEGIVGAQEFLLVVNEDGSVTGVREASAPLGYGLDEAAAGTLANWRFQPATLDGRPVKVQIAVQTKFCLY